MEVVIEGTTVRNERDVHQQLADQIDFGPHYGWNLAALWDRLSADVPRPLLIIWRHADQSRRTLGAESFADLVGVLARAAGQDAEAGLVDRLVLRLE